MNVLLFVSAFCVLKYFAWAWLFSGVYGLPSQVRTIEVAKRWALEYFWCGLLAEIALATNLAMLIRLDSLEVVAIPKPVVRGVVAATLSLFSTLCVALLLSWLGRLIRG